VSTDIDVLMPIKGPAPWLIQALKSLKLQSHQNWNLIAVIHGDESGIIGPLRESNIPVKILKANQILSLPEVLNLGLKQCTADVVARMDADDISLPNRFAEQFEILIGNPESLITYSPAFVIDEHGSEIGFRGAPSESNRLIRKMLWKNALIHSTVMFRRESVVALNGYQIDALHAEDYELWLRLLSIGKGCVTPSPGVKYRVHSGQVTKTKIISPQCRDLVGQARLSLAHASGHSTNKAKIQQFVWSSRQKLRRVSMDD